MFMATLREAVALAAAAARAAATNRPRLPRQCLRSSATLPTTWGLYLKARTWDLAAATPKQSRPFSGAKSSSTSGAGGGFDAFLAAQKVGDTGSVIGVDMTPDMISKARANAESGPYGNVDFRLGEIENLPLADRSVDVIISNCVINLSPDKRRVFAEAYRVLKPGGRLAVSDIVAVAELPEAVRQDLVLYTGCMAGASLVSAVEAMLQECGFREIRVIPKDESKGLIRDWIPGTDLGDYLVSANIEAVKPAP